MPLWTDVAEVIILAVSSVATLAVAIAAWLTSRTATRIARAALERENETRRRSERREFVGVLQRRVAGLASASSQTYPHEVRRAAMTIEDREAAEAIAEWLHEAELFMWANSREDAVMRRLLLDVLQHNVNDRGAAFVSDAGAFEMTPYAERALH